MAEPKNETPKTEVKAEVNLDRPISTKELLELLSKMNDNSSNKLAEAIIESRKPYVDPKAEQNEEMFRKQTRAQMAQEREAKRQAQEACPHVIGCNPLSDRYDRNGLTSIIWHRFDSQDISGICTVCQRIFDPGDADYAQWRRLPSANRPSQSGERQYLRRRAV
jgi:hypothetical protein